MTAFAKIRRMAISAAAILGLSAGAASAVGCGKDASGFEAWKADFAQQHGLKGAALKAFQGTSYATATIRVDRAVRKAFSGDVQSFIKRRGGAAIVSRGKSLKKQNAQMFADIERRYGVPPGVILAIWGMETGFGAAMGNQNTLSAVATLAYDCRRPEFFTEHLHGALTLVSRGSLSSASVGAAHGEIGHTQFLPANVVKYGVDGNGDGKVDLRNRNDALYSTANFLRGHGWRAGAGYQANMGALRGWNAASVYQQAIAILGAQIDGE